MQIFFRILISLNTPWLLGFLLIYWSSIRNDVYCPLWSATCDEIVSEYPRPYKLKEKQFWSESASAIIFALPIHTVPYMLAEMLQSNGMRGSNLVTSLGGDISILNIQAGKYMTCVAMATVVLIGVDTMSISKGEVLGETTVVCYQSFSTRSVLGSSLLSLLYSSPEMNCEKQEIDLDIAGPGVRLSTYVLLACTTLSLLMGSFHAGETGTKELGICTLLSMYKVYLYW